MPDLSGNLLLDWLPAASRRSCLEAGERVRVSVGDEIISQGDRVKRVFFPAGAVCSLRINWPLDSSTAVTGATWTVGSGTACPVHQAGGS